MFSRSVSFGLILVLVASTRAEDRKAHPPGENLSATVQFRITNSSNQSVIVDTASFAKKSKLTHARLVKIKPFGDANVTSTVQYNLQSRQLNGFDFEVVAGAGRNEVSKQLTFNDSATTNLPTSGFVNPKNEFVEILVYDDQTGKLFLNVFTRKKL